jgi:hypothetical protein
MFRIDITESFNNLTEKKLIINRGCINTVVVRCTFYFVVGYLAVVPVAAVEQVVEVVLVAGVALVAAVEQVVEVVSVVAVEQVVGAVLVVGIELVAAGSVQ